jgi:hypothetical protein
MNSSTNCPNSLDQQRQRFEQLINFPQPIAEPKTFTHRLVTLGGSIVRFLTADRQLRIWQRTRRGRQVWFAYDPITDQTRQFFSEADVRLWLDTRYYE